MNRIVFLADLHGNDIATLAMEQELQRLAPDEVWFLGDAVGKGPRNVETCDWVRSHCDLFLKGNWDEWICRAYFERNLPPQEQNCFASTLSFYWEQLGEERIKWLDSLPQEASMWISGLHFRLIHGRTIDALFQPSDPTDVLEGGLIGSDKKTKYDALVCADCHRPFVRALNYGYALNTGSIGNSICRPLACALMIEGDVGSHEPSPIHFTTIAVPYDNRKAADIALATPGLPLADAFANEVMTGQYSR